MAISMISLEKWSIIQLKDKLSEYGEGEVDIQGARLYFDGLVVKHVKISNHLVLQNVLFGLDDIKYVERLQIKLSKDFLDKPLPLRLYDNLNIKFVTLSLPFLDNVIAIHGRLQSYKKSDGAIAYTLTFASQDNKMRLKGEVDIVLENKKIKQLSVKIDSGDTRYDEFSAKRVAGWWDYRDGHQSGEISIGSLEWQTAIFDNVQLSLNHDAATFSANLPGRSGQLDADIVFKGPQAEISLASKLNDLSYFNNKISGEADFQMKILLDKWEMKSLNFDGYGDIKGRVESSKATFDFDYTGQFSRIDNQITLSPEECFNMALSLKSGTTVFSIPNKQCVKLKNKIAIKENILMHPIVFHVEKPRYQFRHSLFDHPITGVIGLLYGEVSKQGKINFNIQNADLDALPFDDISLRQINGDFQFDQTFIAQSLSGEMQAYNKAYNVFLTQGRFAIKDPQKNKKIFEINGAFSDGRYQGTAMAIAPLTLFNEQALSGEVEYNGTIAFSLDNPLSQIGGHGLIKINDATIKKGEFLGEGINAYLKTTSLRPLGISPEQMMEVKTGKLGIIPFENGVFYISKLVQDNTITLNRGQFKAMGAIWAGNENSFSTQDVRLTGILKGTPFSGLNIEPEKAEAQIFLKMTPNEIFVEKGIFRRDQTGKVSYALNKRPQFLNTGADYYDLQRMRDILQNFNFSELSVPFNGQGVQGVYMRGTHPEYNNGNFIELDLVTNPPN